MASKPKLIIKDRSQHSRAFRQRRREQDAAARRHVNIAASVVSSDQAAAAIAVYRAEKAKRIERNRALIAEGKRRLLLLEER